MLVKYIVLPEKSAYSKIFSVKPEPISSLWLFLHTIPDFRRGQGMRHDLPVVLLLSILALCCGHLSYEAMEEWCENYQEMIKTHVPFLACLRIHAGEKKSHADTHSQRKASSTSQSKYPSASRRNWSRSVIYKHGIPVSHTGNWDTARDENPSPQFGT